ncbi:MAG: MBL fold metallo-hydrolase [Thermoplasmata archaeon]
MNVNDERSDITLEWFGHSCFRIEIDRMFLYFDPVRKNRLLGTTLEPHYEKKVSAIFVSHEHWDHYDVETILALCSPRTRIYCPKSVAGSLFHRMTFEVGNLRELQKTKERIVPIKKESIIQINEIQIRCLKASEGISYSIESRDKKVLFMGDSVATDEMIKVRPDVILFPVWAVRGEEARLNDFLELAKGELCIPMHYHTSSDALPNFYLESEELLGLLPKNVNTKILDRNRTYRV